MTDAIAFEVRRCDHICENDGTVSLMIKVDPADSRAFLAVSPDAGGTLFIAPGLRELPAYDPLSLTINYGEASRALCDSAFFRELATWRAAGSDEQYLDWLRGQRCWIARKPGHICFGATVPAHVLRIASGAGVAIKPEFSAIPLCYGAHDDQHQHGESAIGGRDRVDVARIEYLHRWSAGIVLESLGHKSWCHVPPTKLLTWAMDRGVDGYLPNRYKFANA